MRAFVELLHSVLLLLCIASIVVVGLVYLHAQLRKLCTPAPDDSDPSQDELALKVFDCPRCGSSLFTTLPLYAVPECGICGSEVRGRAPGLSEHASPFGQTEARAERTLDRPPP